jgi:hypothetical protein
MVKSKAVMVIRAIVCFIGFMMVSPFSINYRAVCMLFDRTASRIPLASNALVIEFTRHAPIASAHRRLCVVGISTTRSANTRHAIPSHHA